MASNCPLTGAADAGGSGVMARTKATAARATRRGALVVVERILFGCMMSDSVIHIVSNGCEGLGRLRTCSSSLMQRDCVSKTKPRHKQTEDPGPTTSPKDSTKGKISIHTQKQRGGLCI